MTIKRHTYAICESILGGAVLTYVSSTKGASGALIDYIHKVWGAFFEDEYGPLTDDSKVISVIRDTGLYAVGIDIINLE